MKKLYPLAALLFVFIWGCSSSQETLDQSAEEKFKYAKSLYDNEDYLEAVNEFSNIILQYPGNPVVDDAQFYLAQTRFKRKEYILAGYEYSKLIKNMPASEFVPEAQYMLADCYYMLSPDYTLDQRYTKNAVKEFQSFIDFFPTNEKVPDAEVKIHELNDKLAHKEYNTAYIYEKLEDYKAALIYYNNVIDIYHDTQYAPTAMYKKIQLLVFRNRKAEAYDECNRFLTRYPNDDRAKELQELKNSLQSSVQQVQG